MTQLSWVDLVTSTLSRKFVWSLWFGRPFKRGWTVRLVLY